MSNTDICPRCGELRFRREPDAYGHSRGFTCLKCDRLRKTPAKGPKVCPRGPAHGEMEQQWRRDADGYRHRNGRRCATCHRLRMRAERSGTALTKRGKMMTRVKHPRKR